MIFKFLHIVSALIFFSIYLHELFVHKIYNNFDIINNNNNDFYFTFILMMIYNLCVIIFIITQYFCSIIFEFNDIEYWDLDAARFNLNCTYFLLNGLLIYVGLKEYTVKDNEEFLLKSIYINIIVITCLNIIKIMIILVKIIFSIINDQLIFTRNTIIRYHRNNQQINRY